LQPLLELRWQRLQQIRGGGQLWHETELLLNICRLQQQLGRPWQQEASDLRELCQHLVDPTAILQQLARLEATADPTPGNQ
jgi:hypothetical protein